MHGAAQPIARLGEEAFGDVGPARPFLKTVRGAGDGLEGDGNALPSQAVGVGAILLVEQIEAAGADEDVGGRPERSVRLAGAA